MSIHLKPGDRFPDMEFPLAEGGTMKLPDALGPGWSVVLFYRGHF